MKKLLSLFLALMATTTLWALGFQVGDLYYYVTSSSKPLTVAVTDCESTVTTATIPETVTHARRTYSVTSIGMLAFERCDSLTSITIPNSVTSIGDYAFEWCSSLTSITIPNSVTSIGYAAFRECSSLTSVTIPNSIASIGSMAFSDCISLPYIEIPNSVTRIEDGAFHNCRSLSSVTIPNSVTSIGLGAFDFCNSLTSVTIPNSVTSIGDYAFSTCRSLSSVTIPNSVTSIGNSAFSFCNSLTSVTIPNSVTSIGDRAFRSCYFLKQNFVNNSSLNAEENKYWGANFIEQDINGLLISSDTVKSCRPYVITAVIPESVTSIGDEAFYNCSSLTSITIPNSVTSLGNGAFTFCSSLTSIFWNMKEWTNPDSISPFSYSKEKIISFTLGENVEKIPANLCYKMDALASVTIPNSVTSIEDNAFLGCTKLTSLVLPNGVINIGDGAFSQCTELNLLQVGTGIKNIGANAFANCNKLYDIYCFAKEPPAIEASSFSNYLAFLHVPCESKRLYMLDDFFSEFKYIECISSDEVKTDDVIITPSTNDVTIIWPTETGADTYTIVIKKGDEVFCTLTFNAEGQLLNIAFAPSRDGNHRPAQYAEQSGNGYRFTVTGLEESTHYTYNIDVRDAANKTINSHAGEFTTQSITAVDNIQSPITTCQKVIRNGQLIILRDGKTYNAMGQEL